VARGPCYGIELDPRYVDAAARPAARAEWDRLAAELDALGC